MVEDTRQSREPVSGTVEIPSGDGGLHTVVDIADSSTIQIEEVRIDYGNGATVATVLELYDEPDGTASGELADLLDRFNLSSGGDKNPDMLYPDVTEDVVVTADGSQDDTIQVTIGGFVISG